MLAVYRNTSHCGFLLQGASRTAFLQRSFYRARLAPTPGLYIIIIIKAHGSSGCVVLGYCCYSIYANAAHWVTALLGVFVCLLFLVSWTEP